MKDTLALLLDPQHRDNIYILYITNSLYLKKKKKGWNNKYAQETSLNKSQIAAHWETTVPSFPLCVLCIGCDRAAAARIWRKKRKSGFLSCRTEAVYYRKVIKGRCDLPAPTFISKVSLLSLCSYFQRCLLKVEEIRVAQTHFKPQSYLRVLPYPFNRAKARVPLYSFVPILLYFFLF